MDYGEPIVSKIQPSIYIQDIKIFLGDLYTFMRDLALRGRFLSPHVRVDPFKSYNTLFRGIHVRNSFMARVSPSRPSVCSSSWELPPEAAWETEAFVEGTECPLQACHCGCAAE